MDRPAHQMPFGKLNAHLRKLPTEQFFAWAAGSARLRLSSLFAKLPDSAIEGLRQKILLHHELADLGVKLGDLAVGSSPLQAFLVKDLGQFLDRLALPGGDLRWVHSYLVANSATVL